MISFLSTWILELVPGAQECWDFSGLVNKGFFEAQQRVIFVGFEGLFPSLLREVPFSCSWVLGCPAKPFGFFLAFLSSKWEVYSANANQSLESCKHSNLAYGPPPRWVILSASEQAGAV